VRKLLGIALLVVMATAGCGEDEEAATGDGTEAMHGHWSGFTMTALYDSTYVRWQGQSVPLDIEISTDDLDYYYDGTGNDDTEILELTGDYVRFYLGTGAPFLECEAHREGDTLFGECVSRTGLQFRNLWKLQRGFRE